VAETLTAAAFVADLRAQADRSEQAKIRRYVKSGPILGVRMKHTFDTAKAYTDMPLAEVERLLEQPSYEARMGAVSVLDFKARRPKLDGAGRHALYELYFRRHDRIDIWDLVDRAAPRVVGGYLLDKPRDPLYALAKSTSMCERRTSITAAFWFIRQGDTDDALRLAEILLHDPEDLINKSVGTGLREVGKVDERRLVAFLDEHAGAMPRVTLRYAVEKLEPHDRERLMTQGRR
jgi:hypothetical protein